MVRPGLRSKGVKRIHRRVPGGKHRVLFRRRKHYFSRDPVTGERLNGVPMNPNRIRKGSKTMKRPERMFGGVLSPSTLMNALKIAIRSGL